ncbi:tyrosine-type recombinase/integrase [Thermoplasma sp.]|uniref:tyrosine-type recombinase/integrase n=1 Tax=Thermoplasma sp. TaxID=1973142 RepID=UPI00345BE9F9
MSEKTCVRFSWHKCRHTYAKTLLRSGVDLETIRIMLGHENLGTTQIYAAIGADEALERISRSNVKFVKASVGIKPIKPCTFLHGPEGI